MPEWYKRSVRDALNGMHCLTIEERGFYDAALDLIYEEEGPISPALLKRELNIRDARTWTRLFGSLVKQRKLVELPDGRIMNDRARWELANWKAERQAKAASGGAAARKRWSKHETPDLFATDPENASNIKDGGIADPFHTPARPHTRGSKTAESAGNRPRDGEQSGNSSATRPDSGNDFNGSAMQEEKRVEEKSPPLVPPPEQKAKRAQPLPPGWEPPANTERIAAIIAQWPEGLFELQRDRFIDNATQNGRTCKDWDAAFRNWIGQAEEFRINRRTQGDKPSGWLEANL